MGHHFSWTLFFPGVDHEHIHVATLALVALIVLFLAIVGRMSLGSGEKSVIPAGKLSIRGFFEAMLEFIISMTDMVIGHHKEKYAPIFASIFTFIFINNLMGLVPGMTAATDNLNTTLALGLFSFAMYNYYGFKENGWAYLKHFAGPIVILAPFMFIVELISHSVRPLSLGLRLMGNIQGDHTVLGIFLDMVPIGVPVAFYLLGLFVSFMQAFIFTTLSMVYISMATAHDH